LVFHEIAHNSLYIKSATPFNESFAQLVGYRAAEHFFRARGDSVAAQYAADRWHDEIVLGEYYDSLVGRLHQLYRSKPTPDSLDSGRRAEAAWARAQLEGPVGSRLKTYRIGRLTERPVNNAQLVSARIYRTRLDLFDRWYEQNGRDVGRAVADLRELTADTEGDSALGRLARAVGDSLRVEPDSAATK
jgi:predicted aminopeptidase